MAIGRSCVQNYSSAYANLDKHSGAIAWRCHKFITFSTHDFIFADLNSSALISVV